MINQLIKMLLSRWAIAPVVGVASLVFTHNFDRNVFGFCGVKLSPKDFNIKAAGRAAHLGFGVD